MRFAGKFEGADTQLTPGPAGERHEIRLSVVVRDIDALHRAATHQLSLYGLNDEEIEACIGPRLDASVSDCLQTLLSSINIAGSEAEDLTVIATGDALASLGEMGLRTLMAEMSRARKAPGARPLWPSPDE